MNKLELLEKQVAELMAWKQQKENQQISLPLDVASRGVIGIEPKGSGITALTQSVSVPTSPTSINVPKAYTGTELVRINGVVREIPYIN